MPTLTLVTEQCLAPVPGGTGRYTREVGAALAENVPQDWQVRAVSAWHRDVRPARISGVAGPRRLPLPRRALTLAWEHTGLPRVPGDVVHATTPLAPVVRHPRGGALVVTVHDAVPFTHPDLLTPRGAAWHRAMITRAARDADAVVVPTQSVAGQLREHVEVSTRLEVVGEGVSAPFTRPVSARERDLVRARFGLPARYLVAVGTLEPRKGLPTVARALRRLPEDVHLAVVGPTGWGDRPADLDGDRIHLLGRVDDADLVALVSGATISVHASRSEGFGLPLAEAMAAGTPVVHSDIDVFHEVAGEAGRSFAVDDEEALAGTLAELLEDAPALAEMSRAGREAARRHRWEDAAEHLWALYADLATRR